MQTRAFFFAALVTMAQAANAGTRLWTFDDDPPGQLPPGFTSEGGDWKVVQAAGGRALMQSAKNSDPTFNLVLIGDTAARDVDISVDLRPVAGELDQGGGIVWRAKDSKNYYLARYNPLEDNYRFYTVVDGKRTMLANADIPRSTGAHALRVTMAGEHVECYFDGKKVLDKTDGTLTGPGKIGLWTKSDAQSQFDNLKLITP